MKFFSYICNCVALDIGMCEHWRRSEEIVYSPFFSYLRLQVVCCIPPKTHYTLT